MDAGSRYSDGDLALRLDTKWKVLREYQRSFQTFRMKQRLKWNCDAVQPPGCGVEPLAPPKLPSSPEKRCTETLFRIALDFIDPYGCQTSFHILSLAINHNKRFCNGQSWAVRTVCTLARRALRAEVLRVFWSHFCMHGVTGMTKPGDQQIAIFRSLDKMGYPCENGTENGKWPVSFHCGSFVNLTPPVTAFKLAFAKHPSWVTL